MDKTRRKQLQQAAAHLARHDPVLRAVINASGICTIVPHTDYYRSLVDSIIGQQLSVKAAAAIKQRFRDLFAEKFPEPAAILELSTENYRTAGLSYAKAGYISDLAQHIIDGRISFDRIDSQTNEEILSELTAVKGIGEWTGHMFLMFCVGRLDILPTGDLGVRNAIRDLYGLEQSPTPRAVVTLAAQNQWHPYESVASWYLGESYDTEPFIP